MKLKQIIIIAFFVIPFQMVFTQSWQKNLAQEKSSNNKQNFYQIQKAFNDYWEPFNVKNGKYLKNGIEVKAPGWKLFKRWDRRMNAGYPPSLSILATGYMPHGSCSEK